MKIKVFPRDLLETKWSSNKAQFDDPVTPQMIYTTILLEIL